MKTEAQEKKYDVNKCRLRFMFLFVIRIWLLFNIYKFVYEKNIEIPYINYK